MMYSISILFVVMAAMEVSISSALVNVPRPASRITAKTAAASLRHEYTSSLLMASKNNNDQDISSTVTSSFRRAFFTTSAAFATTIALSTKPAAATLMDTKVEGATTFKPGEKLSISDSKKRFTLARQEIQYLLDNYTTISKEGGDAVRRYLGTVGVNSNMYGITKILKDLREESEDIVEYQETLDEFNAYLFQAEGAAYQSLFVEHSSAKGTPESFLATAKKDVIQMQKFMDQLAVQLNM